MGRLSGFLRNGTGCACLPRPSSPGKGCGRAAAATAQPCGMTRRLVVSEEKSVWRVAPRRTSSVHCRTRKKETILTNTIEAARTGFATLGISGMLLKALESAGMTEPKPIQAEAIPHALEGRDILGLAQTGSGKTAAFALPILARIIREGARNKPRTAKALILAPTRELAVQIEDVIRALSRGSRIFTALVLGGVSRGGQVRRLAQGVDVLIATPGRLADLMQEGAVTLSETRYLVLDEADRMLDMGFIHEVRRIAKATHPDRQTQLFSATMPREIESLAASLLKHPVRVEVARQGTTAAEIRQSVIMARVKQKRGVLAELLSGDAMKQVIVFARTKHGADRVARDLERDGFAAAVIHGNKSQNARQRALNDFRTGRARVLVATDIAARGIDVPGISHVVNYDLPDEAESYVHRIGRTGRNGASGEAITLCDPAEMSRLRQVERLIRQKLAVTRDVTGVPAAEHGTRAPASRGAGNARSAPVARKAETAEQGRGRDSRPHAVHAREDRQAAGKPRQRRRNRRPANQDQRRDTRAA
ncbi:DEAD/DEAH box helicase [Chelativorans composti]